MFQSTRDCHFASAGLSAVERIAELAGHVKELRMPTSEMSQIDFDINATHILWEKYFDFPHLAAATNGFCQR
jgi:hypothetical protein